MKLWLFETISGTCEYDEYDSFAVAAQSEERAKTLVEEILNRGGFQHQKITEFKVRRILLAEESEGVLISSFNAG